jgi:D-glycero-D-manno-heptose 1,7-bisphosphate phosphatase
MKAVFLDRDGVINRKAADGEYITNWLEMEILPGALAAAVALDRAGYLIFVVTNQRGVATGKILEADLNEIHRRMKQEFVDAGASIKAIYCCRHDVHVNCQCRKPKPGMLFQAAREHNLNLADCWIIGDSSTDIEAGFSAGCKTAQIIDLPPVELWETRPDIVANNLRAVVTQILGWDSNSHDLWSARSTD